MNETLCYTIIGVQAFCLLVSLAFNVKSFRGFTKRHVLKWQWLWVVEERLQEVEEALQADAAAKSQGLSRGWTIAATLVILMLAGMLAWEIVAR